MRREEQEEVEEATEDEVVERATEGRRAHPPIWCR